MTAVGPWLVVVGAVGVGLSQGASGGDPVTCGSVLKLLNLQHHVRLHSHDVKYGSGSGQQSCTGMPDMDDHNSHWLVKAKMGAERCRRGEPVRCGAALRLEHVATGCNLHSHLFRSPLSSQQEVSCFGQKGHGDTGDNWTLECEEDEDFWRRSDEVRLRHVDTGLLLAATAQQYGRPIAGQNEIAASRSPSPETRWKAAEGVFIQPQDPN